MAISFSDSPGNLFNIIGALGGIVELIDSTQTSMETILIDTTSGIPVQLETEPDIQAQVGSSYISILNGLGGGGSTAASIAAAALNRIVFRDSPRPGQTLQSSNTTESLREVIRQMKQQGATVLAHTIGSSVGAWTGVGNGVVNVSTIRPFDGLVLENAFEEDITLTCTADSFSSSRTAGNEVFSAAGEGAQSNPYAFNWPAGSGGVATLNVIRANSDNTLGNILTNSGFEAFTNNVPDNWSLDEGVAGTNIFEEVTLVYDPISGGKALRITGDGAGTNVTLSQQFNASTGTAGTLTFTTQYSHCIFLRRDGIAAGAGVLTVELVDGNDTVIQDENGVDNSYDIDLTALTTEYVAYTGSFRTPYDMPDEAYIRYRLSTALTDGRSVYLDAGGFGVMQQVYVSGPFLAIHSGSIPFQTEDFTKVAITNSRGSGGTLSTFQTLLARFFSAMISSELLLPSSSSPSISDNLIG